MCLFKNCYFLVVWLNKKNYCSSLLKVSCFVCNFASKVNLVPEHEPSSNVEQNKLLNNHVPFIKRYPVKKNKKKTIKPVFSEVFFSHEKKRIFTSLVK